MMLTFNSLFCYFKANNITYLILLCITNTPWQQKTHHLFIIIKATHTWNQERWPFWEACFLRINIVIELKITLYRCFIWDLPFDSNWGNQCLLFSDPYILLNHIERSVFCSSTNLYFLQQNWYGVIISFLWKKIYVLYRFSGIVQQNKWEIKMSMHDCSPYSN